MIYVISDIHGKYGLYRAMLEKIGLGDDDDNEPNIHMLGLSYKFKF